MPIPAALGLASTAAPRRETAFTRPDAFHRLEHRWDVAFANIRPMPPHRVTCATSSGFHRPRRPTARTKRGDRATSEITPFLPCPRSVPRLGLPSSSARRNVAWVSRPPSPRPYRSAPATSATGRAHGHMFRELTRTYLAPGGARGKSFLAGIRFFFAHTLSTSRPSCPQGIPRRFTGFSVPKRGLFAID